MPSPARQPLLAAFDQLTVVSFRDEERESMTVLVWGTRTEPQSR